jgi:hypothetical protein
MCAAGYKWFEHYSPYFVAVLVLVLPVAVRRAVLGIALAALLAVVFDFAVGPAYLKWIHGPYAPHFPRASSATRILEDLKLIDEAQTAATPKPANDTPPNQ